MFCIKEQVPLIFTTRVDFLRQMPNEVYYLYSPDGIEETIFYENYFLQSINRAAGSNITCGAVFVIFADASGSPFGGAGAKRLRGQGR